MYLDAEVGSLLGAVAQTHGSEHIPLGGDAHTDATALTAFVAYLLPEMILGLLDLIALGIVLDFIHNLVYLLHLQVYDVVHDALGGAGVTTEEVEVETGFGGKGIDHIAVKVDTQQSTAVVGTERYLATGIGTHCAEAEVGIAVGDALAEDGIPEEHTWLGALPCVVHYLLPQLAGVDGLGHHRLVAVDGELLHIVAPVDGCLHEGVVELHAHVGASHLALGHLGVDKRL